VRRAIHRSDRSLARSEKKDRSRRLRSRKIGQLGDDRGVFSRAALAPQIAMVDRVRDDHGISLPHPAPAGANDKIVAVADVATHFQANVAGASG
jgi:hypothetical protein